VYVTGWLLDRRLELPGGSPDRRHHVARPETFASEGSTGQVPSSCSNAAREAVRCLLGHDERQMPTSIGALSFSASQQDHPVSVKLHLTDKRTLLTSPSSFLTVCLSVYIIFQDFEFGGANSLGDQNRLDDIYLHTCSCVKNFHKFSFSLQVVSRTYVSNCIHSRFV